jgi:pimeloyl-ACP methyl ester carboxylesterase
VVYSIKMKTDKNKSALKIAAVALTISLLWLGYTPDMPKELLLQKYSNGESKFVANEHGLRVHFRDQGDTDARAIVLLHGNSNSLHTFEPLVNALVSDYRVISLDFPGHGLTGAHPGNDYGYRGLSEALELVVDHLSLKDFTLLGHSMGGWVSWRYAVDNQDQLRALILMSASGMPPRENDPISEGGLGFKLLGSPIGPLISSYTLPRSIIKKSTEESMVQKTLATKELVDTFWELLREPENRRALAYRAKEGRELEKADLAKSIKLPTLLIWGEQDSFVYPSASTSFSERIGHTQTLLLPSVGHLPMLESTEAVAVAIHRFIGEN